jgi:glyoxylase-like metal-dependent hydrolase (beta-lactamase superfamily II)
MATAPPPHPYLHTPSPESVPAISPAELVGAREGDAPPVVVDLRPARERRLAHLPGDLSIPLSELPSRWGELPTDRPVVVYCQFGGTARRGANFLREHGLSHVALLEGGLDEYSRIVDPTIARYSPGGENDGWLLQQFPRPDTGCLAYLVGDLATGTAAILDPGIDPAPYLAAVQSLGLTIRSIVETHTHADHLAGHAALHERTGAPIVVSHRSPAQYPHRRLAEGDSVEVGDQALVAWETPGHTRDHLTLRLHDKAFTGDTLLIGSCGRTDLGDGSPQLLWESLTTKLLTLPDDTEIFPAHYGSRHALPERYVTTLGFERATNEALGQRDWPAFERYMTEGWPAKPSSFDEIVRRNLSA